MDSSAKSAASTKHVVIVGAGFAGLNCAKKLASDSSLRITLIDKNNYQQFQPLFLSAGSEANFFGISGANKNAFPMYSLRDAERLRSRLLGLFEAADVKGGAAAGNNLHFLVVGAGATGVETAGALADILQRAPKHLYPNVDLSKAVVTLVDMGTKVLPPFTERSQDYAARILKERGVQLRLGLSVKEVTESDVLLSDGSRVPATLVVWAGGLKAAALSGSLGIKPAHGGRLDVQSDLTVAGCPGVYALGDFANTKGEDGKPLPQLASVAQQAGRHCADNIIAITAGKGQKPFAYFDKGVMAMIGRNAAVAEIGSNHHPMTGAFAFAAWLGVHALLLTTVRAKLDTFFEWAWDYFGSVHVNPILDQPSVNWTTDKSGPS